MLLLCYTISALPSSLATIKAYNSASSTIYGIHSSGKGYVKVSLNQDPLITYQMEDSLWNIVKTGLILSKEFSDATLTDAPVQQDTSDFAGMECHLLLNQNWLLLPSFFYRSAFLQRHS